MAPQYRFSVVAPFLKIRARQRCHLCRAWSLLTLYRASPLLSLRSHSPPLTLPFQPPALCRTSRHHPATRDTHRWMHAAAGLTEGHGRESTARSPSATACLSDCCPHSAAGTPLAGACGVGAHTWTWRGTRRCRPCSFQFSRCDPRCAAVSLPYWPGFPGCSVCSRSDKRFFFPFLVKRCVWASFWHTQRE